MNKVAIVDYGRGNLFSVSKAVESCNAIPTLTESPTEIENAERVILPGVGAFGDAMAGLSERNLVDALRAFVETGRPLLGICLGMQMLLEESHEHGRHEGFGWIKGTVERLPQHPGTQRPKVPAVGWHPLRCRSDTSWDGTLLEGTVPDSYAYFVHSYAAQPKDAGNLLATYRFGDAEAAAVILCDNVSGCQFHPEKSGQVGLNIISRWMAA